MDEALLPRWQTVLWADVHAQVAKVNSTLAHLIDEIDPDKDYPLIQANYRYGEMIVTNGRTQLSSQMPDLSLNNTSTELSAAIQQQLSYASIPLFLVLHNAVEVFMEGDERFVPLNIFYPGSLLGLLEVLDAWFGEIIPAPWWVSAGGRHVFTLPKLSDKESYAQLRRHFALPTNLLPRNLEEQWGLFRGLAQQSTFPEPWHCQVLFFTAPWLQQHPGSVAWAAFHRYLMAQAWEQSQFALSKISGLSVWSQYAKAFFERRFNPSAYIIDQIKHLLLVTMNRWPGFVPALPQCSQVAPFLGLQQVVLEIYGLRQYWPTMFHISSAQQDHHRIKYYSLGLPTMLEGVSSKDVSKISRMVEIREMKQLMEIICPVFATQTGSDGEWLRGSMFEYIHFEEDPYQEILHSPQLPQLDPLLYDANQPQQAAKEFCATSQFWRGCFRIIPPASHKIKIPDKEVRAQDKADIQK